MRILRVTGEQLIATLDTHVDTAFKVILESLASEEAAEWWGHNGTGLVCFFKLLILRKGLTMLD